MGKTFRTFTVIKIRSRDAAPMQGTIAFARIDDAVANTNLVNEPIHLSRIGGRGRRICVVGKLCQQIFESAAHRGQIANIPINGNGTYGNLIVNQKNTVGLPGASCADSPNSQ